MKSKKGEIQVSLYFLFRFSLPIVRQNFIAQPKKTEQPG